MKQWTYTGRVFEIEDFAVVDTPIGSNMGQAAFKDREEWIDIAFLPDGRIAEIELREWVLAGKEERDE